MQPLQWKYLTFTSVKRTTCFPGSGSCNRTPKLPRFHPEVCANSDLIDMKTIVFSIHYCITNIRYWIVSFTGPLFHKTRLSKKTGVLFHFINHHQSGKLKFIVTQLKWIINKEFNKLYNDKSIVAGKGWVEFSSMLWGNVF